MKLDKAIIASYLGDFKDTDVIVYGSIDSTNLQAKRMLVNRKSKNMLIVANSQTAGIGRNGKGFYSPAATGVYLSVVTHPDASASDIVFSTSAAAVAVTRAIEALTPLKPSIKWVNDIYIEDKKICGILTQAVQKDSKVDSLIIGVGINISTSVFPTEIKSSAGSLNCAVDRNRLAAEIAGNIFSVLQDKNKSFMDEYRSKSNVIGKEITYYKDCISHNAKATDINDNGGLIVIEDGKEFVLTSGEISVRVK